ncbi:ABC transporter ATP-binding protein [Bacillus sp. 28A-2]|uniref:ABC transporter ATP-binding protein n=1 Tax=Bacillus sp. 28A-2 TaxID=2772252 RepID=UPI00168D619A|nr:ABC transporter ATP-binding protein [Bacillus sp. 28A-2]MBD3858253.1 ABC transporter ATP-binding protein [Bacillus sp. 28A-2]
MKKNWLFLLIARQKWLLFLALLFVLIEATANLAMIGLQKWLIDDVLLSNGGEQFNYILMLFAIVFFVYVVMFVVSPYVMHKNYLSIHHSLQKKMMDQLQQVSMRTYKKHPVSFYLHKLNQDVKTVAVTAALHIPKIVQTIFMAVVLSVILLSVSPILFFLLLFASTCYFIVGKTMAKKATLIAKDVQERKSDLFVHVEEGISSTREIVAFDRRKWEIHLYEKLFNKMMDSVIKEGKFQNKLLFLTEPLKWVGILSVLLFGTHQVAAGKMSIGLFVVIYQYASQLMKSYQELFQYVFEFFHQRASIHRISEVLHVEREEKGTKRIDDVEDMLFEEVCFSYEQTAKGALDRLNLHIPKGKKVAIVGASGSGKSTISKLAVGLYRSDSGRVLVNGVDLKDIEASHFLKRVAVVPQEPYFFPDSIRMNLIMGLTDITDEQLEQVCEIAQILSFIKGLEKGFDTVIGERGISLSGGQRQRLAIARALLKQADLLILDEATSALDRQTERKVQKGIDDAKGGNTMLVIAHRLSTIQNADMIYVLEDGGVQSCGTHEELMEASSHYRSLFMAQVITAS